MRLRGVAFSIARDRPVVDLDAFDLSSFDEDVFRVLERRATGELGFVQHERFVSLREQALDAVRLGMLRAGPAPLEVPRSIEMGNASVLRLPSAW